MDVSKHVHNPPAGSYEPMSQKSTRFNALGPRTRLYDHSLIKPPLNSGCRTLTPMTYASPVDMSNRIHNVLHVEQPLKCHVSTVLDAPMSIKTYHNLIRRTSTCFDVTLGSDIYHNTKDMSS